MKKITLLSLAVAALVSASCGGTKNLQSYAPEETGLNIMKITDESSNSVLGPLVYSSNINKMLFAASKFGSSKETKYYWSTGKFLSVSPDGKELAYVSRMNNLNNVMIRKTNPQGTAMQRTNRDVIDVFWGSDEKLYYTDRTDSRHPLISSVNAKQGTLVRQLTSNNNDTQPVLSSDGKLMFFVRTDNTGPTVWSLNLENGALTSCALGYNPCVIPGVTDSFICVRNSSNGNSEIWLVNYEKGQETIILSDMSKGFTNPSVSPDGKWIVCQGNAKSNITKKNNLDIYAVKLDGTSLIQLTYHPEIDACPQWSADGKSIYFLSTRGNEKNYYNVWKMRFDLN